MPKAKHPIQPIGYDRHGVIRFKENKIIRWLCDTGKLNLNETAVLPGIPKEDHEQLAQLLGYSVSGFGELPYVSRVVLQQADEEADRLIQQREASRKRKKLEA